MADTRTLGDLIDRIASELDRDDLGSSATFGSNGSATIYNAVRDAIFYYQRLVLFSNEAIDQSVSTVTGTEVYNPPDDLVSITQLDIVGFNTITPLIEKPYQQIDAWDANVSQPTPGRPEYYAFYNQQVRLYPRPDSNLYTLRFVYQKEIPVPTAATDINFWTTEGESLIRHRAKWLLHVGTIREPQMAEMDKMLEQDALYSLERETTAKLFTGTLTATRF